MSPIAKYAIWGAVIAIIVFAGYKGYQMYKADQGKKGINIPITI
jgi:hypothetical protein